MLIPTPRLLLLALFGLAAIALTSTRPAAFAVAIVWLLGAVLAAVIDAWFVPPHTELAWTREHDSKLSLGAPNLVTLCLRNRSDRELRLQVRDAVPAILTPEGESGSGECGGGAEWRLRYRVFPIHRGDYFFGPVTARYLGPLGLAWRQQTSHLDDSIRVYPNLLAIRQYESLERRGHLEEIGLRNSRRWGSGSQFERLRDYTPDDEFRRINWPATARRHKPIAVDYETERNQTIMLVLDAGRLMSVRVPLEDVATHPARALTRLDYAVNAALLLAFVSQQRGDRIGLMAFGDRVSRYVSPGRGRRQFLAVTEALYNLEAEATEANYGEALEYLAVRNRRRSLTVVFTDIAEPEAAASLVTHLAHLARRHLPLVVTLRDPAVESLATIQPRDSVAVYERAVAGSLLDDRSETLSRLRQRGVLTLDTSAEKLSPSLINQYLAIKARTAL